MLGNQDSIDRIETTYIGCTKIPRACSPHETGIKWSIMSKIGEKSKVGDIYQACCGDNCDFVLKIQNKKDHDRETSIYDYLKSEKMSGVVVDVIDHFVCGDRKKGGGIMIMEKMDITLSAAFQQINNLRFASEISKLKAKIKIIEELENMIDYLHLAGVIHNDAHVQNFMCKYNTSNEKEEERDSPDYILNLFTHWKIIDLGKAVFIKNLDPQQAVAHARNDYQYIRSLLH
jgi:serine/threonine protein kinase